MLQGRQRMSGGSQKTTPQLLIKTVNASRDLNEHDVACILECTGSITINLPNTLGKGFQTVLVNVGVGTITVTADGTLFSKGNADTIPDQYAAATLYNRGNNQWVLLGDIA